jgi:hypothetical protein
VGVRALRGGPGPILVAAQARGRARVGAVRSLGLDGRCLDRLLARRRRRRRADRCETADREHGDQAPMGRGRPK